MRNSALKNVTSSNTFNLKEENYNVSSRVEFYSSTQLGHSEHIIFLLL
jgi:hypothetical protein